MQRILQLKVLGIRDSFAFFFAPIHKIVTGGGGFFVNSVIEDTNKGIFKIYEGGGHGHF